MHTSYNQFFNAIDDYQKLQKCFNQLDRSEFSLESLIALKLAEGYNFKDRETLQAFFATLDESASFSLFQLVVPLSDF